MRSGDTSKSGRGRGPAAALAALLLLVLPLAAAAARTPAEYGAALKEARGAAARLGDYAGTVAGGDEKDLAYERELIAELRAPLAPAEKIVWDGGELETGNQWLEAALNLYAEEEDWEERRRIVAGIDERLAAIAQRVAPLAGAATDGARAKDEDKRKLAEILRREEFQKPAEKQESWFQRLQRRIREWFNEKFPRPKMPEGAPETVERASTGMQIVLYALVLGFIGFLIYRFAPFFADRLRRREKREKGERVILGEKLGADEDARTLFEEADELARRGELRAAIRKGYIAFLCELGDRRVIGLAQHKTNRDYLRAVRREPALYGRMSGLTESFERHWYGLGETRPADWEEFKRIYAEALK